LIKAQAATSNKTKHALWKQIRTTEKACATAHIIHNILMDNWRSVGLFSVIGPAFDGTG